MLDQREIAMGAFLDIEGAFNNTRYDTMCDALVRHGIECTILRWIKATLEGRVTFATLNEISLRLAIFRGCPHGGVLSPLLWCLVVNDLITRLSGVASLFKDTQTTYVYLRWVNSSTRYQD